MQLIFVWSGVMEGKHDVKDGVCCQICTCESDFCLSRERNKENLERFDLLSRSSLPRPPYRYDTMLRALSRLTEILFPSRQNKQT